MKNQLKFQDLEKEQLDTVNFTPGTIIKGKIEAVDGQFAIVNAGLKSESRVNIKQFADAQGNIDINIGDELDFLLVTVDNGDGLTILSREQAIKNRAWDLLSDAFKSDEMIVGKVLERKKGGFLVDLGSVTAFLPGSHAFTKAVRENPEDLEGKEFSFLIVKMEKRRNNIVVSRKLVQERESIGDRKEILETMKIDDVVTGVVKNLTDYGAFIDLGGVDGLLHITDISWKRLKHPSEVIKVGEELTVKVLNHDQDNNRVSLGLKQMVDDPWVNIDRRYPPRTRLHGKVTNMLDYGCFIEIEDGIEGLVHMSELDWSNKNIHPSKILNLGDEVEVMVLDIDAERRRISLGIKQCKENPWSAFCEDHSIGDKVTGQVKSITDFGVFIGLPGGIDGLVHVNDITWDENGEERLKEISKGDELTAVIISLDPEKERISLGLKQLEDNPFEEFLTSHHKGDRVVITVSSIDDGKLLGETTQGLPVVVKKLTKEFTANINDHLEVYFLTYDKKMNMLSMSITEPKQRSGSYSRTQDKESSATFGDLMKKQLEDK
ncbi:MAG: 30S ribosomal protein S1 [Legionellales bacterium]|nr:30S ribosomal protein S1 [Legionellales bacterium]OUX67268.1 MAG: 30S ribosomal protein S1 [bacterium TMED178]|tara:strand:+ start:3497 stop:5140 length:1644 start_codon:yes stop_codon:yes gene_type:complete